MDIFIININLISSDMRRSTENDADLTSMFVGVTACEPYGFGPFVVCLAGSSSLT